MSTAPVLDPLTPAPVEEDRFSHDLGSDYGLVSPDGKFFACDAWDHSWLGRRLGAHNEKGYLLPGWVHVAGESWDMDIRREPTQGQIDTAFAWCQAASWRNFDRVKLTLGVP